MAAVMRVLKRGSEEVENPVGKRLKTLDGSVDRSLRRKPLGHEGGLQGPASSGEFVNIPDDFRLANQTCTYSRGAIISIRLVNFQVATDSTFRFGPFLNIVLGSNGTGKSTIVNAIYLLFRGKVAALDRRNHNEFIQHGQSHAVVSAQIQGDKDGINPVIGVRFFHQNRLPGEQAVRPQWYINGTPLGEEAVDKFIAKMHIQVENLCQFLPQFRVAAFSSETAQQRLISTERAVGYDGMVDDHKMLAASGSELSELTKDVDSLTTRTQKLIEKRDVLVDKVAQLELANKDKEKVDMLTRVVDIAKYLEVERDVSSLQAELDEAKKHLRDFDIDSADKQAVIVAAENDVRNLETESVELEQNVHNTRSIYEKHAKKIQKYREKANDVLMRITSIKIELESASVRIERFVSNREETKLEVGELRKQLNGLGGDTERFNRLRNEVRTLENEYTQTEAQSRSLSDEQSRISREISHASNTDKVDKARLAKLNSATAAARSPLRLREVLRGDNGNMERSIAFIDRHKHMFEKPVIMPALLSLNIKDPKILPIFVEVVSLIHLQKFVCQSAKDQQTLTELAAKNDHIDIKTTYVSPSMPGSINASDFDQQTLDKLKKMGFSGILSDQLEGPEPMLEFMKSLGVNRVPYALSQINSDARDKIKSATSGTMVFADNKTFYRIQRSRYGLKLPTETSKLLSSNSPPWAAFMLRKDNSAEIQKLEQQIETSSRRISQLQQSNEKLMQELSASNQKLSEVGNNLRRFKIELGNEDRIRSRLTSASERLKELHAKIEECKKLQARRSADLDKHLQELNRELANINSVVSEIPSNTVNTLQSYYYTQAKHKVVLGDAINRVKYLKKALAAQRELRKQKLTAVERKVQEAKDRHRDLHNNYEAATSWLRSHKKLKEGMSKAKSTSVTDIEDEINRLNATVNLHDQRVESLASVQQQLQIAETQLAEDERQLTLSRERLSRVSSETLGVRRKWESGITDMVAKISDTFSSMFAKLGCRGNITLDRDDPLAVGTWGIDINLAFREEEETLSKLSKFRQSGGERAVSTAVYLLALQDMATAPFRVLDEINQGMDEKNERMTMKFFVDMACQPNASTGKAQQYFLVTPKLISNLPCHHNMNVTFIFGGSAVGDTDKLMPSTKPLSIMQSLEDEIDSENESDDDDTNN